jgi:dTMP kinase
MSKKPIIVFEGIEGSGKSYHITNVSKYLKKRKIDHIRIREPGGSLNSEKIRKLILNNKSSFNRDTDLLLYLAARSENMDLLKKYYKKKINIINKHLLKNFKIDFTFLNIVNNKNMIKRLKLRKSLNRYDRFNNSFYKKVQMGFLKLSKINKRKYQVIDSNLDIKENKSLIINKIKKLI